MSKPTIKVLWVFPSFARASGALSAPVRRFVELAPRLGDDYEHVVCAMDQDWSAEEMLPEDFAIKKLKISLRKTTGVSLRNMWSIRKALGETKPSLVATSNWPSIEWLMVNRGPGAIPHVHFEDPEDRDDAALDDGSRAWGRRRAFPGRDRAFVAPCQDVRDAFVERWGAAAEAVHVLPAGVDPERFAAVARREADGKTVIGMVAPMIAQKRFDRLLRLVATLRERGRDVSALLIGEGPERARIDREIAALKLEGHVGFGEGLDLEAALARMDVYAITSDAERTCPSLPVAMAAGLPVVATDVSDVRARLDDSNALFVRDLGDESALVAAAELLSADRALRETIGEANRQRARETMSYDGLASRLDGLFRRVSGASWALLLPAPGTTGQKVAPPTEPTADVDAKSTAQSTAEKAPRGENAPRAQAPRAFERRLPGRAGGATAAA